MDWPMELAADGVRLAALVTAPPEDGKANAALIKLLAKTWKLPKTTITVAAGAAARDKTLLLAGDGTVIAGRLRAWFAARG